MWLSSGVGALPPGLPADPLSPPQVVVVVKYLFQFGFFPWNSYSSLVRNEAKPFFPPRILGLEKTDHYLKFDLVQLMALFFHRSLLLVRAGGRCSRCMRLVTEMPWGDLPEFLGARP